MLRGLRHIAAAAAGYTRATVFRWWGGIGCRVAFIMLLAILLVSSFIGAYLLSEGKRGQESEMRGRALYIGSYVAALAFDDLVREDRQALQRKLALAFLAQGEASRDLLFLVVFDRDGRVFAASASPGTAVPSGHAGEGQAETPGPAQVMETVPRFSRPVAGTLEVLIPVLAGDVRAGSVKVGISDGRFDQQLREVTKKVLLIVMVLFLIGLVASQMIAAGITRPVERLNMAVEELGRQNWKTPIPVRGSDELARLASSFNQMALALQEREASLSQGNRDLFLLHSAGLDLMESLDLAELLRRTAARAGDLIKSDTTTIAAVDRGTRMLQYLGAEGSRAGLLQRQDLPIEAGGIYNWLATYGTPLLIPDARNDFRLDAEQMAALGVRSLIAVPLWSSNSMIAVLTAVNKTGGEVFDRHDLRLCTVFANIAGAALQNALLYQDLKDKMTELTATQQQLVHSSKMAAIGELAANVAHEINNPLTSVLGYTSHLLRTLELPEESRSKLQLMEQETLRVRKIIRNLLDFSRPRPPRMQSGDLVQPVRETVALLHGVAERGAVRIIEEYPPAPVAVSMDQNELKQVFINIMNNALHAMPGGGNLTVRVAVAPAGEAVVEIADTGPGITAEHRGRVFEPFFTTKSSGDGTGLGLSISYRIIQNHRGRIELESEPGSGALFRVFLPLCEQNAIIA